MPKLPGGYNSSRKERSDPTSIRNNTRATQGITLDNADERKPVRMREERKYAKKLTGTRNIKMNSVA